jgi:malonyl-CoA/methylmalonyl-CoA synthetase
MNDNLCARLFEAFDRHPGRVALRVPGGPTWTFRDLRDRAGRAARALQEFGVRPGDRVIARLGKHPDTIALYLGCLQVGAVYVPLNTAYTPAEVAYFVDDAEPALFVSDPRDDLPEAALTLASGGGGTFGEAMGAAAPLAVVAGRTGRDLAAILYTSGTTGRSKGAMLSHDNLYSNALALRTAWGWRDDDVLLHALPVFHVHGLFIAMHCALLGGTPTIFMERFDALDVQRLLAQATVFMGVPTFYTRLLALPDLDPAAVAGVRVFISGSAPLTEQTFDEFEKRTGHRILERYGMSETIINTTNPLAGERVAGTVGFALPGIDVRIADDAGFEVPRGTIGTIEVRGSNVFAGYWRMPDKTASEFRSDGFFVTGDLGAMDGEGRVSIAGRAKDLVISGGYNVYPKEVEAELDALPEIRESAVIGVPHPDFGEAVVAIVVPIGPAIDESLVAEALADRLARFKQPKRLISVTDLPRNAMGKVQKNELRTRYAELFTRS